MKTNIRRPAGRAARLKAYARGIQQRAERWRHQIWMFERSGNVLGISRCLHALDKAEFEAEKVEAWAREPLWLAGNRRSDTLDGNPAHPLGHLLNPMAQG